MSLAIQINLNKAAVLDGTSELPAPSVGGAVTKTVDSDGIVVLTVDTSTSFGAFDPGSLLGSRSADFVLQSLQVSSAGSAGLGPDNIALDAVADHAARAARAADSLMPMRLATPAKTRVPSAP
jgi:hypothetical protein